jgi:hypothetical protein
MSLGEFHAGLWSLACLLAVIAGALVLSAVHVLRGKPVGDPEAWTEDQREGFRRKRLVASMSFVLAWSGALVSVMHSPLLLNGALDWSYLESHPGIVGVPMAITVLWLTLVLPFDRSGFRPEPSRAVWRSLGTLCHVIGQTFIWLRVLLGNEWLTGS